MNVNRDQLMELGVIRYRSEYDAMRNYWTVEAAHRSGATTTVTGVDPEALGHLLLSWAAECNQPPEPKEPEAVIDGELIGFREWRIMDGKLCAKALVGVPPWLPGVNEARCEARRAGWTTRAPYPHLAPNEHCDCGLYALAEVPGPPGSYQLGPGHWITVGLVPGEGPSVTGAVRAWGERFYLHPTGFRAQYAEPVLLAVSDRMGDEERELVRRVAREYRCDVVDLAYLKDAAKEHGQLVPTELLPEPEPDTYYDGTNVSFAHTTAMQNAMAKMGQQMQNAMANFKATMPTVTGPDFDIEPASDPVTRARAKFTDFGALAERDQRKRK